MDGATLEAVEALLADDVGAGAALLELEPEEGRLNGTPAELQTSWAKLKVAKVKSSVDIPFLSCL